MLRKPDLKLPCYNARYFSWNSQGKSQGTAEASDVSPHRAPHAQVWSDACDVGFFVYSPKTDVMKLFLHAERIMDESGEDVKADRYASEDGFEVILFND